MLQRPVLPVSFRFACRHAALVSFALSAALSASSAAYAQGTATLPPPPLSYSAPSASKGRYIIPDSRYSNRRAQVMQETEQLVASPTTNMPAPPPVDLASPLPSPRRLNDPMASDAYTPYAGGARYGDLGNRTSAYYAQPSPKPIKPEDLDFLPKEEEVLTPQTSAAQPTAVVEQPPALRILPTPAPAPTPAPMPTPTPVAPASSPAAAVADAGLQPLPWDGYETPSSTPQPTVDKAQVAPAQPTAELTPPAAIQDILDTPDEVLASTSATPTVALPLAASAPLSEESKAILAKTPSGIDSKVVARTPKPVVISRTAPNAGSIPTVDVRTHEEMGLKIVVRKANPNVHALLEEGYENLLAGRESVAAGYYNEALQAEPKNEMALLGLATTYQRLGQMQEARDLYGELLAINPTHREALNNFMALVSNESPQEAITELEKLETENPDFSPIPAQLGVVYDKLGDRQMAARKLSRALELSPENVSYKYNLAIILDQMGQKQDAADLYTELVEDYNHGANLPGNVEDIRNRIIFLSTKG